MIQPPTVRLHPLDTLALLSVVLIAAGCWLAWSIGVALLVLGILLLLAIGAGQLRR